MRHWPGVVASTRGRRNQQAGATTSMTGTLIRNTDPHQKCSSSAPPTSGPTAAPADPTVPQRPSAMARSPASSKVLRIRPSTQGMIIEPPSARHTRAAISAPALCAKAAQTEAAAKITRPVKRMRRLPTRSDSVPIGTSSPAISKG